MSNTFDGLRRAAGLVNSLAATDAYPDLADLLLGSSSTDYNALPELNWQLVQRRRVQQFPDALLEQYDLMEARSFLGVFPEISRAWFTVDNRLYLWDYEAGKDLYAFEQQDQIIVSVGLARPIPGVFVEGVEYVMIVATPLEITLLGVTFEKGTDGSRGQITLYQTQMAVAADGVSMTSIVGTLSGRIFMGGSDGNIYELAYQAQEGWFTRKCYKINHSSKLGYLIPAALRFGGTDPITSLVLDNERNLLYSLSANGAIEVVHLGIDGKGFTRIAKQTDLWRLSTQLSARPEFFDAKTFRIVSIHVLTVAESRALQLVAITSSGCRLYFSVYPRIAAIAQPGLAAGPKVPTTLDLVHVRLPPADIVGPGKVHTASYSEGLFLAAFVVNEQRDGLVGAGPDFRTMRRTDQRKLSEVPGSMPIESRTISIVPGSAPSKTTISDLINETTEPPKTHLVLTSSGIVFVNKERPLDVLIKLIVALPNSYGAISRFFDHFGRDEAALMCLVVATEFPELQRQALELYSDRSGEAELTVAQPTIGVPGGDVGRVFDVPSYSYSGRLNGLALLISRIVRPVWSKTLLNSSVQKGGQTLVTPNAAVEDFVRAKLRLAALRATLARLAEVRDLSRLPVGSRAPDAAKGEQQLLVDVARLLTETIEAIEFIEILHELNFVEACKQLPEVRRRDLSSILTLETIVTDPGVREKGVQIVHDLFKQNPAARGTVDALSASFQQRCPSFVTSKDIVWFRGIELLERSLNLAGPERDTAIAESQSLWMREAANMTPDRVAEIAQVHKELRFYSGTIEIALASAQANDPYNVGLKYSDGSDTSQQGKNAFDTRNRFYDVAIGALENCFAENNERQQIQMVALCYKSTDVLFLFRVYDWLLQKGRRDLLLEGESESLERFLVINPSLEKSNLLWQFLVKSKQHLKASRVLVGLAEAKSAEIPLAKRVEYLSLAVSNAKSSGPSGDAGTLLTYIQDRLEVAQVQLEIMRTIEKQQADGKIDATAARDSLAALNSELYDVTELYKDFASKFGLHDAVLALLHVSKSAAQDLVTETWISILKDADNEGRASGTPPSDPRFVSERVQTLGMRFYPDENVFPLYALCKSLEDYGARHNVPDKAWVIRLMRNVGVPFRELFEKYDVMFLDTKTRGSPSSAHVTDAVCALIELWLQTDSKDLRSSIKTVNDTLVKMMLNGPSPRLTQLQQQLQTRFTVSD